MKNEPNKTHIKPYVWKFFHHEPHYYSDSPRQLVKSPTDKAVETSFKSIAHGAYRSEESTFQEVFCLLTRGIEWVRAESIDGSYYKVHM